MPPNKTYRIIHISDLHGNVKFIASIAGQIKSADLVALSGDLTNFGGKRQAAGIVDAVREINPRVIAVPGNCDRDGVSRYIEETGISVDCKALEIGGYRIAGMGGSLPAPVPMPCVYTEEQFTDRFHELSVKCTSPDILVIHQPPVDSNLDKVNSGAHVGSRAVRSYIEASEAIICLTGHIHESVGVDTIGDTTVVNPGPARHGRYALIEIQGRSAAVSLKNLEK